jgi:hypothetical protein
MKFMEKVYRRFCADEVKLMLDHMEDNFADFQDYDNKWHEFIDARHYTTVERTAIRLAYSRLKANKKRQELLGAILRQKLNPEKVERSSIMLKTSGSTISALHNNQILASQQAQYYQQQLQMGQLGQYGASQQYKKP